MILNTHFKFNVKTMILKTLRANIITIYKFN